jgi:hypothetical protein
MNAFDFTQRDVASGHPALFRAMNRIQKGSIWRLVFADTFGAHHAVVTPYRKTMTKI